MTSPAEVVTLTPEGAKALERSETHRKAIRNWLRSIVTLGPTAWQGTASEILVSWDLGKPVSVSARRWLEGQARGAEPLHASWARTLIRDITEGQR